MYAAVGSVKFTKTLAHLGLERPIVTCYFRHLTQVFEKAGIEVTSQNRQEIDRIIHDIVGVEYKSCPATWRQVKTRVLEDEAGFVSTLKEKWNNRK
jgi:hypothetical protein